MEYILKNILFIWIFLLWIYIICISIYTSNKIQKFKGNWKLWTAVQVFLNPYLFIYFILSRKQRSSFSSSEKKLIVFVIAGYLCFVLIPFIFDAILG